jgi:hypothetical protein
LPKKANTICIGEARNVRFRRLKGFLSKIGKFRKAGVRFSSLQSYWMMRGSIPVANDAGFDGYKVLVSALGSPRLTIYVANCQKGQRALAGSLVDK